MYIENPYHVRNKQNGFFENLMKQKNKLKY